MKSGHVQFRRFEETVFGAVAENGLQVRFWKLQRQVFAIYVWHFKHSISEALMTQT